MNFENVIKFLFLKIGMWCKPFNLYENLLP